MRLHSGPATDCSSATTRTPFSGSSRPEAATAPERRPLAATLAEQPVLLLPELIQESGPLDLDVVPAERMVPGHGSLQPSAVRECERQPALLPRDLVALG